MADDKGRPLSAELVASPKPHGKTNPDAPAPCVACGAAHGSVGVHIHCLGGAVAALRKNPDARRLAMIRAAVGALAAGSGEKLSAMAADDARGPLGAELTGFLNGLRAVLRLLDAGGAP